MNAQLREPDEPAKDSLEQRLQAARVRRAEAVEAFAAAERDLARKHHLEESHRGDVERAMTATNTNENLDHAERLAHAERVAQARHRAAQNLLANSNTARHLAQAEVQAAQHAVDQVAQQILLLEVRATYERYTQVRDHFNSLRATLLAAYRGAGRKALDARQWLALDRPCFNLQELGIASPEMHVPISEIQGFAHGVMAEDQVRVERARIDQCGAHWRTRLETLSRGTVDTNYTTVDGT